MITLKLGNSESIISGLAVDQTARLKYLMSYELDASASFFSGRKQGPQRKSLLDRRGCFPSGLTYIVKGYLASENLEHTVIDTRITPVPIDGLFNLKLSLTPYKEQFAIAIKAKEVHRGCISAVTGFGKSISIALIVNALRVPTLIVVPNLVLKTQLQTDFKKYFGSLDFITIENIDSPNLAKGGDYDCVIIDEAHHVAAKTYRTLNKKVWNNIYYRFYFTATPFRSRDEEQLLFESVAGQVIYRVTYQQAVSKGYIVPVEAYYVDVPKTEIQGNERSWPAMYNELVVNNAPRNRIIATIMKSLWGLSTICLVKELKHGDHIAELTGFPFLHGDKEDGRIILLQFLLGESTSLIGTVGVLGEGVDSKPAEYVIVAGLGKSKNQFLQNVGRGVRRHKAKSSCKVIIFRDLSHRWTKTHFQAQVKYLEEFYGVKPSKLEIESF